MADSILLERDGPVARITFNRPDIGNAIDMAMARALMETVIACDEDESVRCVLMTGAGRFYCTGGDIASFADAGDALPGFLKEITAYTHSAVARLMRMNKPLVTAINGPAAGAGIGLALVGDFALADESAHFTLAYTGIGMSPDAAATWLLPRLVGLRQAQELCLRNRRVRSAEAASIGLITRSISDGKLMDEAGALAQELARGAVTALGATRRLLLDGAHASLESQLDAESRSIAGQARTRDGREGIASYIEKRAPNFIGD